MKARFANLVREVWPAIGSGAVAGLLFGFGLGLVEVGLQLGAPRPGRRFDAEVAGYMFGIDGALGALGGIVLAVLVAGVLRVAGRRPRPAVFTAWAFAIGAGLFPLAASLLWSYITTGAASPSPVSGLGLVLAPAAYRIARRFAGSRAGPRLGPAAFGLLGLVVAADLGSTFAGPIHLGGLSLAAAGSPTTNGLTPPNVLLITVDTLRADKVGAYGNGRIQTPSLDRLAREGGRFDNTFVQQPQTNTSHTSLLTGTYPQTHGVRVHMVDRLGEGIPTMGEVFAAHGYQTAGIYSWVSLEPAFSGLQRGFQTYEGLVVNQSVIFSDRRLQLLAATYRRLKEYQLVANLSEQVVQAGDKYEEEMDGRADLTTDGAINWLEGQTAAPFFLWVHYYDPHYPYTPPAPFDRLYDGGYQGQADGSIRLLHDWIDGRTTLSWEDTRHLEALYEGEVTFTDQQIGRLLGYLEERGRLDSTLVVVTADHGEMFGEGAEWLHSLSLRSGATQVPLIMRYPGLIPAGTVVTATAEGVDVMPTVLALAGLAIPATVDGQSLAEQIQRPTEVERYAYTILGDDSARTIVDRDWRLIQRGPYGHQALYYRRDDPREERNVAAEYPEVADRLGALLNRWPRAGTRS